VRKRFLPIYQEGELFASTNILKVLRQLRDGVPIKSGLADRFSTPRFIVRYYSGVKMILNYLGTKPKIGKDVFIAEGAKIIGDVEIGNYSSIWFNAVVRGDVNYIKIGNRTNIQDNCVLHVTNETAPLNIGSGVTIGHGVILHGCTIEDNCLIGSSSIIWDGAVIGEGSIVGAGAVVLANTKVPPHSVILGFPAKIKKSVSKEQYNEILESAEHYVKYAQDYMLKN